REAGLPEAGVRAARVPPARLCPASPPARLCPAGPPARLRPVWRPLAAASGPLTPPPRLGDLPGGAFLFHRPLLPGPAQRHPTTFSNSSSLSTGTFSSRALASLPPAPAPA